MARTSRRFLLIAVAGLLASAYAQNPAENPKPENEPPAEPVKVEAKAEAKPDAKANDPFEMLQQAYYLGGQLPADEHAYQLGDLLQTASKMHHPLMHQWVQELLQITQGLPQRFIRLSVEQGGLRALAEVDPAEALQLLSQLSPVTIASGVETEVDDIRTDAAEEIFPKYWKNTRAPDIDALRSAANYLGQTGQYPFKAIGLILPEVRARDATAAEMFFLDAMQYYQREQSNAISAHWDFFYLLRAAKGVVPEAMERTAVTLAVDRLLKQAEEPMPDNMVFVGRIYTGKGFVELHSAAEDTLYHMLPLVREIQPDLEKQIFDGRPSFNITVPNDLGSLPKGYAESNLLVIGSSPTAESKARAKQWLMDRTRADNARRLADTDPQVAVRLADTISDPALRASTLATIAQGKLGESDAAQAAKIMGDPGGKSEKVEPKDERTQLGLLVTQARTQARRNDAELWDTLSRGLDLAERLFEESTKSQRRIGYRQVPDRPGPWPGYVATGFEEAITLIKIGAEKQTANTLEWLGQEHDPALKSYLLISAAEGLWNAQKATPSAKSAAPLPAQ